jgi:signal transduction histidine kinase
MPNTPLPAVEVLDSLITDAFYVVDSDDRIVVVNAAFRDMFDWDALGTARCRDTEFLPCHGSQCLRERCAMKDTVQSHEPRTVLRNAKGEAKTLSLTVTAGPVALPDGQPGTIIILRDVSDDVRLEAGYTQAVQSHQRRLNRSLEISEEMERRRLGRLAQLVAGVVHDVYTPLGVASAAAASILDRLRSGELRKIAQTHNIGEDFEDLEFGVEVVRRNLLRVDELIRKFRKLSAGQMVDVREDLDLGLSTREALQMWSREAKKANLQVDVIDQLTHGLFWEGYTGHLSQVVIALLANVKVHAYPDAKGGKIEVTLASREGPPPEFSVSVRDYGKGISPDILPNVFDPFFTTARSKGCTGLGLSIAQDIVTSIFGGTLQCESRPGAGATFTATFSHCPGSSHTAR